jgi:hypothetical protein
VVAGLVAGTIDIGAACLISGRDPVFICQTIAGGLLAKAAHAGGMGAAALGLGLQWAMSMLIAAVYVIGSRLAPGLARRWVLAGLAYGVVIFVVMNYVVVPLSAWRVVPHFTARTFGENLLAMLLFGLIVAFVARAFARRA